jgi:type VI secretion system protein ImpB
MSPNDKEAKLPPLRDRKYIEIDRDNFNEVMKSIRPRLDFKVPEITFERFTDSEEPDERKREKVRPKMVEGRQIDVKLDFRSLEDFDPINVIKQVKALRDILEARNRLSDLLTKLDGNTDLDAKLEALLKAETADFDAVKDGVKPATGGSN